MTEKEKRSLKIRLGQRLSYDKSRVMEIVKEEIDKTETTMELHGEWLYNRYDGNPNIGNWHCSECRHIVFGGYSQKPYYNFCPNCGLPMNEKALEILRKRAGGDEK